VIKDDFFTNSLMGTTMQDGGKRERSDVGLLSIIADVRLILKDN